MCLGMRSSCYSTLKRNENVISSTALQELLHLVISSLSQESHPKSPWKNVCLNLLRLADVSVMSDGDKDQEGRTLGRENDFQSSISPHGNRIAFWSIEVTLTGDEQCRGDTKHSLIKFIQQSISNDVHGPHGTPFKDPRGLSNPTLRTPGDRITE